MKTGCRISSFLWIALLCVFAYGASLALAGDPIDCSEPTRTFPISPTGDPAWCDGYSGVHFDVDQSGVRSNYRWEVHSNFSVCWNGLNVPYTVTALWPDDPFTEPGTELGGATNDNGDDYYDYTDPCRPNVDSGFWINPPFGFRAPLHPLAPPGLGDFLPPSPTLEGSTAALVPSGAAHSSTWWNDATRQTLHQTVDLVTGLPLARVQELELPFDGATFRLIRTRSGNRVDQARYGDGWYDAAAATDRWWDHAGQGWMINENPVLIVDSAVADLVGNNPRTTWLVLDAHHSIPFQQIESTGIYAAPPRFRAKLTHNGTWKADSTGRMGWDVKPTQMDVYLYDGALKYSFVIVREDMPQYYWNRLSALGTDEIVLSNLHDRPFLADQFPSGSDNSNWWDPFAHCINPGLGLPYLGLCVSIEDNYGHQVEINYCSVVQQAVPYQGDVQGSTDGSSCTECGQACARKGMIRSVNLKTRGETRWSLLYAYRGFRGHNITVSQDFVADATSEADRRFREQDLWGMYQIDRIYVYKVAEGQQTPEQQIAASHPDYFANGLVIDHTQPLDLDGNGTDPLAELLGTTEGLADDWTHLVQHHYVKKLDPNGAEYGVWNGGLKVMTSVTSRSEPASGSPTESVRRWVFHHSAGNESELPFAGPVVQESGYENKLRWLSRIYTPTDVADVLSATDLHLGGPLTIENLVRMTKPGTTTPLSLQEVDIDGDNLVDHSEVQRVANYASYQFGSGAHYGQRWPDTDGRSDAPNATKLLDGGYLVNDAGRLMTDMHYDVAGSLVAPDEDGRRRYYQINRLRVSPTEFPWDDSSEPFRLHWFGIGEELNHRSAFVHPYQWHGYIPNADAGSGWGDHSTSQPPTLTDIRWITIIDEFADPADLYPTGRHTSEGYGVYGGEHATKKSQLSRRVVELSPSGYLLRERKWEYGKDGVVRSGGGIGEQYIYQTVEQYFEEQNDPLPADSTDNVAGNPGWPSSGLANDGLTNVRRELLTVERRSIGWSAAELDPLLDETTTGLVNFTKYTAFHPPNETWADYDADSESLIPAASRVQAIAEGFYRGTNYVTPTGSTGWEYQNNGNPILFTSQWIRDPALPNDVTAQIEFVQPTSMLLASLPAADYNLPPDLQYRVQRTFIERDDSDTEIPEEERPVLSRMIVGVPKQVYPGSPWYYPVEREFYDEDGNPEWSCTGQLKDPENPDGPRDPNDPNDPAGTDPYESLTFTFYDRDREGRSRHTVLDAAPGSAVSSVDGQTAIDIPGWPASGWARIGAGEPLNHVTSFEYDTYAPGLCDIYFPSGRRWARRVIILEDSRVGSDYNAYLDEFAREFVFNDLEKINDVWVTRSEGEVKDYRSTDVFQRPLVTRKVRFVGNLPNNTETLAVTKLDQPEWYLKTAIRLGVDGNGRIQQASLLERSPSGALLAVGSKMINDLGELYREQEIDETITVQTRNSLGQTLRVYQGTEDRRWYVPPSHQGNYPQTDMVLLERSEYGTGVNDVWQPTVIRRYDRSPAWAYDDLHGEVEAHNDVVGRATMIGYDWLSRAVRTDQYARGNPFDGARRLGTNLVYLDYLDRPYLEVTYGADPEDPGSGGVLSVPQIIDPTAFVDAEVFPKLSGGAYDIALFYEATTGQWPVSLVESIYGLDGGLEERRTYDVGWDGVGSPPYLAEFSYSTRGGNASFSQAPGGQVEVTRLDSLGRVASTFTAVPSTGAFGTSNTPDGLKQLTRTDLRYDTDGNVIETISWERVRDAGIELNGTNAVRTRTVSWYDLHKRVIATADLGTESSDGYRYDSEIYTHEVPGPGDDVSQFAVPYWDDALGTVQGLGNLPPFARVMVYAYDDDGNKVLSVDPDGVLTRFEYSSTNRLLYKIENAAAATWGERRMSGYRFEYGRLVEMNLAFNNCSGSMASTTPPVLGDVSVSTEPVNPDPCLELTHRTRLEYGGEIVWYDSLEEQYWVVSQNNKLIRSMHLPNEQTGDPADEAEVFLRYTFSGQIAERYSGSGEAFRYRYDDLDRLESVEAGHWDPSDGYPTGFTPLKPIMIVGGSTGLPTPTDKIGFVEYTYDDRGNLSDVHAWTERDPDDRILIAHTRMDYERDRLAAEWQGHGESVGADTPRVDYAWAYLPTDMGTGGGDTARTGHHRLTGIEYPVPDPTTTRRVLTLQYGAAGSETDLLSRVTSVKSSVGTLHLADFAYTGAGRRSALSLKNGRVVRDHRDTQDVGLIGVDSFGATADVHFRAGISGTPTLYRAAYGFDRVGNRTSAVITQAPVGGQPRDNIRSVVNAYDRLGRLTASEYGEAVLSQDGTTVTISPQSRVHADSWTLDLLGNWVGETDQGGNPVSFGRSTTGTLDGFGVPWSLSTHTQYTEYAFGVSHSVNQRHAIASLGLFEMYEDDPQTAVSRSVEPVYDGAGRLVFDGEYVYQYDHWGRLVQVNEADHDPLNPPTDPEDVILSAMGPMLKHYVYDGLGRLIRTTAPVPDPDTTTGATRAVHFYYDGARRIQEIRAKDVLNYQAAEGSGDPELESLAAESTNESSPDGSNTPLSLQSGQLDPVPYSRNIYREYVWGPGDWGFDEILLQTDEFDDEYWCIQDGGGDLVALVTVVGPTVTVVRQWTYDAYGAILTAEHMGTAIESRIGHKGLFVERLDVGVGDATDPESPSLVPYAHAIYHNRNRTYAPMHGRFLQMDPNQTAMALMSVTASHGRGFGAISIAFSMEGMYGDGLNLYQYLGSNTWTRFDPLGLSWDNDIDALIDELVGGRAGTLSALGKEAQATALVAARIMSMLPIPMASVAGDLALYAMGEQSEGELAAALALGIIPGGKLAGKLFKSVGNIGGGAWGVAKGMAARGRSFLRRSGEGMVERARILLRRKPSSACGCFTAATMVWTAQGMVPITNIEEGQYVYAAQEDAQASDFAEGQVGTTIYIGEASLVKLTVRHTDGSIEVIHTTDEHPFHPAHTGKWTRADQLQVGDHLSTMQGTAELLAVEYGTERVPVYNLSIPGSPTYYVGTHGLWVHNRDRCVRIGYPANFRDVAKTARALRRDGLDVQAHHAIEKRMFRNPMFKGKNPDDFVGVVLTRQEHQRITNALRAQFPYGMNYRSLTPGQIRTGYKNAYDEVGMSHVFEAILPHLR